MIFNVLLIYLLVGIVVALAVFRRDGWDDGFFNTWPKQAYFVFATIVCWPLALWFRISAIRKDRRS